MGSGQWAVGSIVTTVVSYRDLKIWQAGMDLAVATYGATKGFPHSETYGLTSQLRRSAASIAANIAEGYGRESTGSYIQFLKTARGSLKEYETHVILSERIGLLARDVAAALLDDCVVFGKMLNALIRALERK